MIVTKTNPVGLDFSIQLLQQYHYEQLAKLHPGIVHHSYGRIDRNRRDNNYIAEVYLGDNRVDESNEYREIFWNDEEGYDVVTFFGKGSLVKDKIREEAKIHLITFCNLRKLFPEVAHRPDEEAHVELIKMFGKCTLGFHYDGCETGIENVLREYTGSWRSSSIKNVDMHPIHAFRLNFTINYNPKSQTPLKLQ
jgi:hypothetical protein